MFDPSKLNEQKLNERVTKQACAKIKTMVENQLPKDIEGMRVSVREVVCGDPECAPIDTLVEFWVEDSTGFKGFGIPAKATEVEEEDVSKHMPPHDIVQQWLRGEDPEWPFPDPAPNIKLRFKEGDKVELLVGSEVGKDGEVVGGDWEAGTVVQCWYRRREWPMWGYAPYSIRLDVNNRTTFAISDLPSRVRAIGAQPNSSHTEVSVEEGATGNRKRQLQQSTEDTQPLKVTKTEAVDQLLVAMTSPEQINSSVPDENQDASDDNEDEDKDEGSEEEYEYDIDDDNELPHSPSWRFELNDQVLCYTEEGWLPGTVVRVDEEDPEEESWSIIPYVVQLHDSEQTLISVPYDNDFTIKPNIFLSKMAPSN